MPRFAVPGEDAFFVYADGDELSHAVLYHDIGDSIANARAADILFIGNSRMPLGLREEVIVPAAQEAGLRVFSLAMGHSERARFALDLIRKQDLRPSVVVACGGPRFYDDRLSERAAAVERMSGWQARREAMEVEAGWAFRRALHRWLPRVELLGGEATPDWVIYRSVRTGWWRPAVEPQGSIPVGWAREQSRYDEILPMARELKGELDKRGVQLVLTAVPFSETRTGHLPYLSEALGVPAVLPAVEGLATSDGSHLTRGSGERYARAFWGELMALPAVRQRLGLAARPQGKTEAGLAAVRSATEEMRAMLEDYYGGSAVLRKTWYLQPGDPRYDAGIAFLAEKVARALLWRDRFVIGTIGSSVTAGFDNCHDDTYQRQLERLMAPLWAAAGVEFEVRNTGQGGDCGDSFDNQVWCIRSLVGDDVDMTQYSWTYFEAGEKPEELQRYHELFYRWSLLMEHAPVPQLLYTHDCSSLGKTEEELLDAYGRYGANVLCMERGIKTAGYPGKQEGVVGDSLHRTTRYGAEPGVGAERRDSLGVVFRNWHPGPLLFQTTADAIAYSLSDAILRALDEIANEPYPQVRWPRRPRLAAVESLPGRVSCPREWCEREVPRCTVYEKPTFGERFFRRIGPSDRANRTRFLAKDSDAEWLDWSDEKGFRYVPDGERHLPQCEHPARCAGLIAPPSQQAGWLTFELTDLQLGFVAVCCSAKRCGQTMIDAGARFLLDGEPLRSAPKPIRQGKCVALQERFDAAGRRAKTVQLGVWLPARQEPIPAITHVIGL